MKIEAGVTSELCCNISEVLTFVESGLGPDKIRPSLIVAAVAAVQEDGLDLLLCSERIIHPPLTVFRFCCSSWHRCCCVWLENEITVVLFGRALKTGTTWPLFCFVLLLFLRCEWFLHLLLILAAALSLGRGSAQQLDLVEFINAQFYGHGQGYIIYRSFDIF